VSLHFSWRFCRESDGRWSAAARPPVQTPGAHPIVSADELRSDAFESDEELEAFLAFVSESRHADVA